MPTDFDTIIDRRPSDSSKWGTVEADVLPLTVADMDFRAPVPVIRALRERAEHGIYGYPRLPEELGEVIAARMARRYGWQIQREDLVYLPGVIRGLNLACHAFARPGEGALAFTPVYGPITSAPGHAGLVGEEMALTCGGDGRYTIDWDHLERTISPLTRLLMLCNPHNPVGRVFTSEELTRLAEVCLAHDLLVCSDEIHCELVLAGRCHTPIASLSPEVAARTVTLMAPSKTFNIAGLHFSVAIIQDPELRARFCAAGRGLIAGIDIMGMTAALAAYRDGDPWLRDLLRYLEGNLDIVVEYVHGRLRGLRMARPEGTFLAWLDCRESGIPGDPQQFFLERGRVMLSSGLGYGRAGAGFVRLNYGCPRSILVEALERMRRALGA